MKTIATFFGLLFLALPGIAQVTWQTQYSGVNRELTEVFFTDPNNGWISGWTGTILNTSDRGSDWEAQSPPPTNAYWTIDFSDDLNGWAAGYAGLIVHTTDGGETWTAQTSPTNYDIYSIDFISNTEGWAVGGAYGGFPSGIDNRIILHTTDAGATWSVQYGESYKAPLKSVMFTDGSHGFATSDDGILLKTTDGGMNWTEITVNGSFQFSSVFFVNDMEGYLVGLYLGLPHYAGIFKSVDGGETWTETALGEGESLSDVYFTDEYNGWAVGGGPGNLAIIYRTTDGGASWVSQPVPDNTPSLYSVFFTDAYTGWAVGHLGTIISTVIGTVGVDEFTANPSQAATFSLEGNYPNPFTTQTRISYQLPKEEKISMKIYSITGQLVRTLVEENAQAGSYEVSWDGTNDSGSRLNAGIYLCQLRAGDQAQTKRLNLVN